MQLIWFLPYLVKYLILAVLLGGLIGLIFPPIGGVVFLLLLIGGVGAAWTDAGKRRQAHEQQGEAEGFDQALRSVQNSFRQK